VPKSAPAAGESGPREEVAVPGIGDEIGLRDSGRRRDEQQRERHDPFRDPDPHLVLLIWGGVYGSGVPGAMGGHFFRLCSNSTTIFMAGPAFQVFRSAASGYSSFGSVMRSNAFGVPSLTGGVHQSRCSS